MLDPVAHIFIGGCGHGAHHLFQVGHPQVGMGTLPPPHRRGLTGLLLGRLSVQLSQVGTLRFGQLALCQGQKATSEDICPYLQPSTLASKSSCLLLAEPSLRGPFSPIVYQSRLAIGMKYFDPK